MKIWSRYILTLPQKKKKKRVKKEKQGKGVLFVTCKNIRDFFLKKRSRDILIKKKKKKNPRETWRICVEVNFVII